MGNLVVPVAVAVTRKRTNSKLEHKFETKAKVKRASKPKEPLNIEDYERICLIGEGSYGKVYGVKSKATGKLFALKALSKKQILHSDDIDSELIRVKREKVLLEGLDHPFIVKLLGTADSKMKIYFLLELVEGGNLEQLLGCTKRKRLPEKIARFYMAELLLAVEHLHLNGVIHRDIKLSNVLLTKKGHVVLSDFGISTFFDAHPMSICGTPSNLPPEIIQNTSGRCKEYDFSVDLWSLGVCFFHLLYGKTPFEDTKIATMFKKIQSGNVIFPRVPVVSDEAKNLILGLLKKNPKHRLGRKNGSTISTLKQHPFFKGVNFTRLENLQYDVPITPPEKILFDVKECLPLPAVSMNKKISSKINGANNEKLLEDSFEEGDSMKLTDSLVGKLEVYKKKFEDLVAEK